MMKPIQKILVVPKGGRFIAGTRERFFYPDTGLLSEWDYASLKKTIDILEKNLHKYDFDYTIVLKPDKTIVSRFDLVITVGGDGTFLRTSHMVEDVPMIGINSNPKVSVGALLALKPNGIAKELKRIKEGKCKIHADQRIDIIVNGKTVHVSPLNDVLFANNSPAAMSRYLIKVNGKKENQRSSGVWVSTPGGSTAAIRAAGGKLMKMTDKKLQFLVREPYKGPREKKYHVLKGMIGPKDNIQLVNQMHRAGLFIDGTQAHVPLNYGDTIEIKLSKKPLFDGKIDQ